MIIQEAEYKKCECCNRSTEKLHEEIRGCDLCKTAIPNDHHLQITVFSLKTEAASHDFCSWKHVLEFVRTVTTDHFISLPYLNFDYPEEVKEFLSLIK